MSDLNGYCFYCGQPYNGAQRPATSNSTASDSDSAESLDSKAEDWSEYCSKECFERDTQDMTEHGLKIDQGVENGEIVLSDLNKIKLISVRHGALAPGHVSIKTSTSNTTSNIKTDNSSIIVTKPPRNEPEI